MQILTLLSARLAAAVHARFGLEVRPEVTESTQPEFGDYQTNVAMQLRGDLGRPPREIAQEIVEELVSALDPGDMIASAEVAGPGFINLRLAPEWLATTVGWIAVDGRLGVSFVPEPRTVVVDFSSPNVAKRMHVGHLRSTIIGDAIVRLLRFVGHRVISDNHVGDWGTQFGTLLWGWKRFGDEAALASEPVEELERIYREATALAGEDPEVAEACRAELAALQAGDPENLALWNRFVRTSRAEAEAAYEQLGVTFDLWRGESDYHDALEGVVADLESRGLAVESQGALIVPFEEGSGLDESPFMVRKSDGAYLYSTTDIATLEYRVERLAGEWLIYVVDKRQSLHFKQLFHIAGMLGYEARLDHVGFGMMLGADGRPFRTREGGVVRLTDLIDEAEERLVPVVAAKWPDADEAAVRKIAHRVGIGAIKYADLSFNLSSDYKFDWDRMLAAEGNTGPYLQYTLVRLRSIFRVFEERQGHGFTPAGIELGLAHDLELGLARELARLGDVIERCARNLTPHILCDYLYTVARAFNSFYAELQVVPAAGAPLDDAARSRLLLCHATRRVLEQGLDLLNIPSVQRM